VVVDDFNVERITRAPAETNTPLLIHANTVLSRTVTLELFESVSRRDSEIAEDGGRIQHPEFPKGHALDVRPELSDGLAPKETLCVVVPEALDHVE
jgi:hypothetical protein